MAKDVTKLNVNIETSLYDEFKIACTLNYTDASKAVRKFIANYIKQNEDLLEDYYEKQKEIQELERE